MKIAIYSKNFYPSIGGVEITSMILANVLDELGYNTKVITETPLNGKNEIETKFCIRRVNNILSFIVSILSSDLVIVKGGISLKAGLFCVIFRKKIINYFEMHGPVLIEGNNIADLIKNILIKVILMNSSMNVGVSDSCLNSKGKILKKIKIYNPINSELTQHNYTNSKAKKYDILFVGRLIRSKGIMLLLDSLMILEKKKKELFVCIVGDGEEMRNIINEINKFEYIKFDLWGSTEHQKLKRAYLDSKFVVFPSIQPEGMGLVLIESLFFGLPVIVSDQEASIEVIGDAGVVVKTGDVEDLSAKIECLTNDNEIVQILSERAIKRSELFSLNEYKNKISYMLNEIIN